jgi:hypothetical protein
MIFKPPAKKKGTLIKDGRANRSPANSWLMAAPVVLKRLVEGSLHIGQKSSELRAQFIQILLAPVAAAFFRTALDFSEIPVKDNLWR